MPRIFLVDQKSTSSILTWLSSQKTTASLAFCVFLSLTSFSVYANDSESDGNAWKTIHIDHFQIHFQIHFQQRHEQAARSIAAVYMLYLPILAKEFDVKPERIDVVVKDNQDRSNGSSTPIPENTNTIYLTPPIDGQLISQESWTHLVSRHELTHLYYINEATGVPSSLRGLLGRFALLFPNIFQPNWAVEGLATY